MIVQYWSSTITGWIIARKGKKLLTVTDYADSYRLVSFVMTIRDYEMK